MPKAVDQCVKKRLANAKFKAPKGSDKTREQFAYALCTSLHKEGKLDGMSVQVEGQEYWSLDGDEWFARDDGNVAGFRLEPVTDIDLENLNQILGAETDKTEILKFSNAFLAREETNKNKDELTRGNLEDIAKTLPLRAIDFEHREHEIVGLFINAEVKGNGSADGVSTGGIIYARRRPDVAMGLMKGELSLSIEADADKALCSMCEETFTSKAEYCTHLETRLQGSGAVRRFPGAMVARGGAVTKSPAGTETSVPTESIVMIANQIDVEEGGEDLLGGKAPQKSYERIRDLVQDALNVGHERHSPTKVEASPWIKFTFPGFVIIRSGGKLFKVPYKIKKDGVELEEWKEVEETFVEAMREAGEAVDKKPEMKGGVMDDLEKVQAELAEKVKALEALEGEKGKLETELEAAQKERDDLKDELAKKVVAHKRELELLAYLKPERIEEKRDAIDGMTDDAFALFLESLKGSEEHKAGILGTVAPGAEEPPEVDPKKDEKKSSWVSPEA